MGYLLLILFLIFTVPASARPADPLPQLPTVLKQQGKAGTVERVVDGDTLVLAPSGREIRLVGIQAPKLPLGRAGFKIWQLAHEARRALIGLTMGKKLNVYFGGARRDRHGRVLGHLARVRDGLWIQGALLRHGWARVYSFADNQTAVSEMLALERAARQEKLGIWGMRFYQIVPASKAGRFIGSFQLVEGQVTKTAVIRRWAYINFGANWRKDFTISIPRKRLRGFRKRFGRNLRQLEGKHIRVRGWLRAFNGPMIKATHMEQIEVITP